MFVSQRTKVRFKPLGWYERRGGSRLAKKIWRFGLEFCRLTESSTSPVRPRRLTDSLVKGRLAKLKHRDASPYQLRATSRQPRDPQAVLL
jgi:hypothetical protein